MSCLSCVLNRFLSKAFLRLKVYLQKKKICFSICKASFEDAVRRSHVEPRKIYRTDISRSLGFSARRDLGVLECDFAICFGTDSMCGCCSLQRGN